MTRLKGNKNAVGNTGGRPVKYTFKYVGQVEKIALLGATDKQIAYILGVSERTLNYWKVQHIEFSEALRKGKMIADAKVAQSLFLLATGFSYEAEKVFVFKGLPFTYRYQKHVLPSVTAQIFWLMNRQPKIWKF